MPELSRFFGIIIRMYMEVGIQHHRPRFHAYYGDDVAIYSFDPIEVLAASIRERHSADWPISVSRKKWKMKTHPIYRVCSVRIIGPYMLHIVFDDRTEQSINFQPVLAGNLFGPLRDLALFNQVQIDPEVHTLIWPNGADFDPATLHDWPELSEEWAARVQQWRPPPAGITAVQRKVPVPL